jgi:hypothetical protein
VFDLLNMDINQETVEIVKSKLSGLIGQKAWGAKLGIGSFLTCEFGKPLPGDAPGRGHGEWHLWLYCCAWRLEHFSRSVVGSDDNRSDLQAAVSLLNECTLLGIDIQPPSGDAVFHFDNEVVLRLFSCSVTGQSKHWMVFTPKKETLSVGPGTSWSLADADTAG